MKAEAMSYTFIGNEGVVKIPFFQRGYVWNKSNWEDLLIDLFEEEKSHFIGSLILKQQKKQTGKSKEVLVIDGQQRLTTLSVLIKAIYDSFSEETKKNCLTPIQTYLFYKKNPTDSDHHVKIQHSRIDAQYYQQVINSNITDDEIQGIDDSSNKILQCYKYFVGELKKKTEDENKNLFNRLLHTENKILVLIDLDDEEDEQAIFDTINSAGVRLSSADIIKNALFQRAIQLFDSQDDVVACYTESWENIFSKDDDAIGFWEAQRATGRLMRDNIEILLHCVSVIKGFFDPDKHTLSDLSTLYKNKITALNKEELEAFISEIKEYAELYREKILTFDKTTLFSFEDNTQRLFHVLDVLEISTFHPYILGALKKYKNDEAALRDKLLKIEKYVMRRMITRKETKSYNKVCKEFIADENSITEKINEIDSNQLENGLQSIGNKKAALILFWIELARRYNDGKYGLKELKYNYSLEHVMPQKWEEHWNNIPIKNSAGEVIENFDEASKVRQSKIYSIGNMTLLTSKLNTSLRNYNFEKKVCGDGRKKGLKSYSDLSITKDDIILKFDNGDKVWDEEKITKRTDVLRDEVLNIW